MTCTAALSNGFTYNGTHYTGDQAAVAQGDNFLSQLIPQLEGTNAFQDGSGMIEIWFDESEGGDTSDFDIPEIIISKDAIGNAFDVTEMLTHSADLLIVRGDVPVGAVPRRVLQFAGPVGGLFARQHSGGCARASQPCVAWGWSARHGTGSPPARVTECSGLAGWYPASPTPRRSDRDTDRRAAA